MILQKEDVDILLINPPLGTISNPYISIPVLKAYLSSKQIKVMAFDLNQEFLCRFVNPQNIQKGKYYLENQFAKLNNKKNLSLKELYEYSVLFKLKKELDANRDRLNRIFFPYSDFSTIQQLNLSGFLLGLSSLPYYPEFLSTSGAFVYYSQFSEFSSDDIIKNTKSSPFYARETDVIIDELLLKYNPKIVGLSVTFQNQVLPAFWCARRIKEKNSRIHVTLGGAFLSIHLRDIAKIELFSLIDSLILDEGETALEELLHQVKADKPDFQKVPGIRFLKDNNIISIPPAPPLNMNSQPPPDYNSFNLNGYLSPKNKLTVPFRLSKGCFWKKCSFCRTELALCQNFQQPLFKTMYKQLKTVIDSTGINSFFFADESANPNLLSYISRNLIRENIHINWITHSRVDMRFNKERCLLFKEAGCNSLSFGVESFNNRLLGIMNKGITAEQSREVIEQIDGVIPLNLYMILGIPTQTEQEAWEDFEQIKTLLKRKLIARYTYSPLLITSGSAMWQNPKKYGISSLKSLAKEDLHPNIFDFECAGMSRKKVHQLFTELLSKAFPEDSSGKNVIGPITGNFEFKEIERILLENWVCMYHPHDFLSNSDDNAALITSKTP